MDNIHIGTSGWHYDHWKGPFYPENIKNSEMLAFYCVHFKTAEINNTFYQIPEKKTLSEWKDTVPENFIFTVKASRYITHMKKLKDPEEPVSNFIDNIKTMEEKLGPILFQLPPRWHFNIHRLRDFLKILPGNLRYAFEFRDTTWFERETYEALSEYNASFCIYEFDRTVSPKELTADFVYVRLHGPDGPYRGKYTKDSLAGWADNLKRWTGEGREVYLYFDNDEKGYAVENAIELCGIINQK